MRTAAAILALLAVTSCRRVSGYPGFELVSASANARYYLQTNTVQGKNELVYFGAMSESIDESRHSVFQIMTNCESKVWRSEGVEYASDGQLLRKTPKDNLPVALSPEFQPLVARACQIADASGPPLSPVGAAVRKQIRQKPQQTYSFDLLGEPEVRKTAVRVFGAREPLLVERTSTSVPVSKEGDMALISGCKPHFCNAEGGALVVDMSNGKAAGAMYDERTVQVYLGDYSRFDELPTELRTWIGDQGQTFPSEGRKLEIISATSPQADSALIRGTRPAAPTAPEYRKQLVENKPGTPSSEAVSNDMPPASPTAPALSGEGQTAANLVRSKIRPTQFLLSKEPDFGNSEWQALSNHGVCDGCWYVTYRVRVKHAPTEGFVSPEWLVNLRIGLVTPDSPETEKYFDTAK